MALPKDDGLDGAKVAEVIGVGMPDVAGAVRVSKSPPPPPPLLPSLCDFPYCWTDERDEAFAILVGYIYFSNLTETGVL
jgi:solute carrier family 25 phosphate transporter 23/24/25/41